MCKQANKHHAEKQSPGFAFTLCIMSKYNNTTNAAMGDDKKPSDCIISALLNLFFKRPYFFHNALLAGQDIYQ